MTQRRCVVGLTAVLGLSSLSGCSPFDLSARQVRTLVDGRQLEFAPAIAALRQDNDAATPRTAWKPGGMTLDRAGQLWVADTEQHRILQITPTGVVSLHTGSRQGFQDGDLTQARFDSPSGIVWSPEGLLVADAGNQRLRRITPTGEVQTLTTLQPLQRPVSLALDQQQRLLIADAGRRQILRRSSTGEIEILVHLGPGRLLQQIFFDPEQRLVFLDNLGLWRWDGGEVEPLLGYHEGYRRFGGALPWRDGLLLSDLYSHQLRFWRAGQRAETLDLQPVAEADGPLRYPALLLADGEQVLLAELGQRRVHRLRPPATAEAAWQREILARSGTQGFGVRRDNQDLNLPHGLLWDTRQQRLLVSDYQHHRLLEIDAQGRATPRLEARSASIPLNFPTGLAQDSDGSVYIATAHQILRWRPDGRQELLAGDRQPGGRDGLGSVARFRLPWGMDVAPDGSLYVADHGNHRIRKITRDGTVTTVAGDGQPGLRNGPAAQARFYYPADVLWQSDGSLLVADSWNHCLRQILPDGRVISFTGYQTPGLQDGHRHKARFYLPSGLSRAPDGMIYIADSWNHRIRALQPNGQVFTLAGQGRWLNWQSGDRDGRGNQALFNQPLAITVRPDTGQILVADTTNHRIRELTP
ncbi:MAG: SMP-30/gluconolactonase/LRE family protein [Candidatus Sericytochromatia bacterium]|nr:SMP-30/gluconolactonase/LRE family protein [Candidatus Sericytochromatia bacterium]